MFLFEPGVTLDEIVRAVEIRRSYRLYLGSDKPLYQPGQAIYQRVLALDAATGRPAAGRLVRELADEPLAGLGVAREGTVLAAGWQGRLARGTAGQPSGKLSISSSIPATRAASITRSSEASDAPNLMFSLMVSENRNVSCGT